MSELQEMPANVSTRSIPTVGNAAYATAGVFVDSCRECESDKENLYQYREKGLVNV